MPIARAILKNAPILILDEATSAADPENQVEIDRAIENLCRGKTVVIVAHRLGAIKLCDKVAVVENNTITCCGTHEEVLEKNEYYRRGLGGLPGCPCHCLFRGRGCAACVRQMCSVKIGPSIPV